MKQYSLNFNGKDSVRAAYTGISMKFSNACWLQKQGIECFSPTEVYFTTITESKITLQVPAAKEDSKRDALGGVNLTLEITSPMPEVIRVKTYHYKGVRKRTPEFELNFPKEKESFMEVMDSKEKVTITSGSLRLEIIKENFQMTYYCGDEKLTESAGKSLAYIKTNRKGLAHDGGRGQDAYMRQQLSIGVGELLYGTGEQFTPFVKNGQSVKIWNADGETSKEQSYKNIPFYLSSKGYGILVNHLEKIGFEFASEAVGKVEFTVPGESLDYFFFHGPTMKEVLMRYTSLTGKPSLPAPWTFGLWLSASTSTKYDEETVNSFVDGMLERGIPLQVFHFDCFWMKEFCCSDLTWYGRAVPDFAKMIARLKAKGIKICVCINSYIGQESILFDEGMENGYFIKQENGDVWQWDLGQPGMAVVDFTNPDACRWFQDKLELLLDMGVDCFKTDFEERSPVKCIYADGSDPLKMHNYYAYLYHKTVFELIERKCGKEEAVLFARSATVGGQKFPVHWGESCHADYESMAESLRGDLSLAMSGFGYWSRDIGSFNHTAAPDVYKRWCAFGLLSSHSRIHGSTFHRVPWAYDEESVEVVRHFTKLKAGLMPYLYYNAVETSKTGVPMIRSMVLEYMLDKNCAYLDKQYMLGDSILVAPVLNEKGIAEYYLPEGIWTHFLSGERRIGGKWYSESYDYFSLPLFVKPGSLIAVGQDTASVYDYADGVILKAYELIDDVPAKAVVCNEKAQVKVKARVLKLNDEIRIFVESDKPYKVVLVNAVNVKEVENCKVEICGNDTIVTPVKMGRVVCRSIS